MTSKRRSSGTTYCQRFRNCSCAVHDSSDRREKGRDSNCDEKI